MGRIFPSCVLNSRENLSFPVGVRFFSPLILLALVLFLLPSCRGSRGGEAGPSQHRLFPERSYQELALKGLSIPRQEAVFKDPTGNFQVVRRGDRIGKENMEVIEITDGRMILQGMERGGPQVVVLSLGEKAGEGGFRYTRQPPPSSTQRIVMPGGFGQPKKKGLKSK